MVNSKLDRIAIRGLQVDCVVGVYPNERDRHQPLEVDLCLGLDTRKAASEQRLARTVDYAAVANQIAFLLRSCRFYLLETAAHVLARFLLAPPALGETRAPIEELTLTLSKPKALSGRGIASLEIHRRAEEVTITHEQPNWGQVDILAETRHVGIYRLNVAPKQGIPLHVHRQMTECELVLSEGIWCQGRAVAAGTAFAWPLDAPHRYDNPTDTWQTILCVDSPPFIPDDEIAVEGTPAEVAPQPPFIPGYIHV